MKLLFRDLENFILTDLDRISFVSYHSVSYIYILFSSWILKIGVYTQSLRHLNLWLALLD